jgi:WS/DGAT/MGAT family acyltransferase
MARAHRLSPLDASFLYWEKPHQRLHVGCVALLDGSLSFEAFATAMAERIGPIRRYRERPVRPLLDLDWPRWEPDPAFDVRRHLHHVAVPPPGGERELHALVDELFATRLDPRHPLWETVLIDGVAGGRSALLWKVHHAMIDGVSGAQLLEAMADPVPHAPPASSPHAPPRRSFLEGFRPRVLLDTARDLARAVATFGEVLLEGTPLLPFNGAITDARRIVWTSFTLDDFLAMRGVAGCKVNDVVLAVITGALRRYLESRGISPQGPRPRTLVPVSMRRAEDHMALGNLVTSMFPHLPIDLADPLARLRTIADEMQALKEQGQARAAGVALQLVGVLPAPLNALFARFAPGPLPINTVCTNVPGPREACTLLGRPIVEVHPIVPLFQGIGLEFAIMSYAGGLSITAAVEPRLVPDAERIPGHLQAAAEELRNALAPRDVAARPAAAASAMLVSDLMKTEVVAIDPGDSLATAWMLMRARRIRHLPVVDGLGRLAGLVTHRDLMGASPSSLAGSGEDARLRLLAGGRAADVMETHVSVAAPEDRAAQAGERMIRHKIGCLPVVGSDGRLAGIVTEEDFLRWATTHMGPREHGPAPA